MQIERRVRPARMTTMGFAAAQPVPPIPVRRISQVGLSERETQRMQVERRVRPARMTTMGFAAAQPILPMSVRRISQVGLSERETQRMQIERRVRPARMTKMGFALLNPSYRSGFAGFRRLGRANAKPNECKSSTDCTRRA